MDSIITDLYALAEHCGYKDLYDEMIRDRIIVGLRDSALSEKDSELTLEKAVTKARQVRQQQSVVRIDETKQLELPLSTMEEAKERKHLVAQCRVEQLCKREAPANRCVVDVDLTLSTTVNDAQRRMLCVTRRKTRTL